MTRLAIIVEGQTEEEFVNRVRAARLRPSVTATPIVLGGDVGDERLVKYMVNLRHNFDDATLLVDFYGFRRKGGRSVEALEEHLVQKIEEQIPDSRQVFPYIQKHEFEGLLFSDTTAFGAPECDAEWDIEALASIRRQFRTPEDINDSPETAPSKRISNLLPGYDKPLHGPVVARETGLEKIRAECPRFRAWLTRMERLPQPT